MSTKSRKIVEKAEIVINEGDNADLLLNFLLTYSKCEVYCRPFLSDYYKSMDERIAPEDIGLDARTIKNALSENGVYFHDTKLITRIFGAQNKPQSSSCRWLRNKISHELMSRAIKEACNRNSELIGDMNLFIETVENQA